MAVALQGETALVSALLAEKHDESLSNAAHSARQRRRSSRIRRFIRNYRIKGSPSLPPGLAWQSSQTANAATLVVIPEPSTLWVLLIALTCVSGVRRDLKTPAGSVK
jgi:hypothetical protein